MECQEHFHGSCNAHQDNDFGVGASYIVGVLASDVNVGRPAVHKRGRRGGSKNDDVKKETARADKRTLERLSAQAPDMQGGHGKSPKVD